MKELLFENKILFIYGGDLPWRKISRLFLQKLKNSTVRMRSKPISFPNFEGFALCQSKNVSFSLVFALMGKLHPNRPFSTYSLPRLLHLHKLISCLFIKFFERITICNSRHFFDIFYQIFFYAAGIYLRQGFQHPAISF